MLCGQKAFKTNNRKCAKNAKITQRVELRTLPSGVQPTRREGSAALSKGELEALSQREAKLGSPVLGVYLDTDQSREINIERGFEVVLKDLLREIRPIEHESRGPTRYRVVVLTSWDRLLH